jgi:hypothetical protein
MLLMHTGDCFHVEDRWIIENISSNDNTNNDDSTTAVQRCRATCKWRCYWIKSPYFVKMIIEVHFQHTSEYIIMFAVVTSIIKQLQIRQAVVYTFIACCVSCWRHMLQLITTL